MNLWTWRFNYYLLGLALVVATGCVSSREREQRREQSEIQLFIEAESDIENKTAIAYVFRSAPVPVRIYKTPFLDGTDLVEANVADAVGGFVVQLAFTAHGRLVLEQVTTARRGARIAVYGIFPTGRWLAAPIIPGRITNGVLTFTPDMTREEAERLVRGLNNVAARLGNKPRMSSPTNSEK